MTALFALAFPAISLAASLATIWALVRFVREIRADYRRSDTERNAGR
jgi:hypothetical protein